MRQYARQIDGALRPFMNGLEVPLILVATEPIDRIYRSVNTYPHLLAQASSETRKRSLMPSLRPAPQGSRRPLRGAAGDLQELYARRFAEGRTLADFAEVARAASFGAVETLLLDIDASVPVVVDDQTGAASFADVATGDVHDVTNEIARRAWLGGARVLAVRERDVPSTVPSRRSCATRSDARWPACGRRSEAIRRPSRRR